jgi:Myb/SANT-like DNA-binding protein
MGRPRKANKEPSAGKPPNLSWSEKMESELFEALLDQQNVGKYANVGWKKEAWPPVIQRVQNAYTGPLVVTKTHCQSKEGIYKTHYKDHVWLVAQSGFTYDEETGLIDVVPEAWEEVVKVSPTQLSVYMLKMFRPDHQFLGIKGTS